MYKQEPRRVFKICPRLLRFFHGSSVFHAVGETTFGKGFIFRIFFLNLTAAFYVFSNFLINGFPKYFIIHPAAGTTYKTFVDVSANNIDSPT